MKRFVLLATAAALLLNSPSAHAQPTSGCIDYERYSHWENAYNQVFDDLVAGQWYLYGLSSGYLQVFDLHAPGSPRWIGSYQTGGGRMALAGKTIYLIGTNGSPSTMKAVDVSDPSSASVSGSIVVPDVAEEIATAGPYAYVTTNGASRSSLQIIDVSNPNAPSLVGHFDLNTGTIGALDVAGSYACIALNSIFFVIDVSNASQPAIVGGMNLSEDCAGIKIVGTHAYALTGTALQVIDISHPSAPIAVGNVAVGGRDIAVTGSLACILGTSVVNVLDISSPAMPTISATVDVRAYNDPTTIAASGSHAYVATDRATLETGHATLHTISLSAAKKPNPLGMLPNVGGIVAAQGTHAYVLSSAALQVVDVSVPGTPTLSGSIDLPSSCKAISVVGSHAYVAIKDPYLHSVGQLTVVDVSNPSVPTVKGDVGINDPCDIVAEGPYAFVADDYGLKIVDVSTPTVPAVVGQVPVSGIYLMAVVDARVYLYSYYSFPSFNEQMTVISVDDPAHPTLAWQGDEIFGVTGVAISGAFMYTCIAHPDNVPIIYVGASSPDQPPVSDTRLYPKDAGRMSVAGNFAYLLPGQNLAHLIDISTPGKPRFVGDITPCGSNIAASGEYIYTAPGDFYVLQGPCEHTTAVSDAHPTARFAVKAFPNPFNPATRIQYDVPLTGVVTVSVYDLQGRKVASLVDHQRMTTGTHAVNWDGTTDRGATAASGIYFARVEQHGNAVIKKITLLK